MNRLLLLALLVLPFQIQGNWWTCPYGYWIKDGRCIPWHEGQDVDYGSDWNQKGGYDYWGLVEQQRHEREANGQSADYR